MIKLFVLSNVENIFFGKSELRYNNIFTFKTGMTHVTFHFLQVTSFHRAPVDVQQSYKYY